MINDGKQYLDQIGCCNNVLNNLEPSISNVSIQQQPMPPIQQGPPPQMEIGTMDLQPIIGQN